MRKFKQLQQPNLTKNTVRTADTLARGDRYSTHVHIGTLLFQHLPLTLSHPLCQNLKVSSHLNRLVKDAGGTRPLTTSLIYITEICIAAFGGII